MYGETRDFPDHERYGITSQLRRAAASIATNLAEGCGRSGDREFGRFVSIAAGSANEVDYLLLLSRDLGYLDEASTASAAEKVVEIRRMLAALQRRLSSSAGSPAES